MKKYVLSGLASLLLTALTLALMPLSVMEYASDPHSAEIAE
jgi:hypothetical protein